MYVTDSIEPVKAQTMGKPMELHRRSTKLTYVAHEAQRADTKEARMMRGDTLQKEVGR